MKALKANGKLWTVWKGRHYCLPLQEPGRRGKQDADESSLSAPYSCKVLRVLVSDGQQVKRGDPVIVVEAMKMEYTFNSPREGKIKRVLVSAGKVVGTGTEFVEWA